MGGTFQPFVVPVPSDDLENNFVTLYLNCTWRENLTLLEFMRRTNDKGDILKHIKKSYQKSDQTVTLEQFAVAFPTFGEKCIAA